MTTIEILPVIVVQTVILVYGIIRSHQKLKIEIDGRLTQLLEITAKVSRYEGAEIERDRNDKKGA